MSGPDTLRTDAPIPGLSLGESNNDGPAAPGPDCDWFDFDDDDPDGTPGEPDTAPAVTVDAVVVDVDVVDADPDPEPQQYCNRHMPHGTDDPCGACGRRRRNHEAWESRNPHRVMGRATAKVLGWSLITEHAVAGAQTALSPPEPKPAWRCPWCRDTGLVVLSDGTPGSTPAACNHDGTRRPATPEDIAEYQRRRRA